MLQTWKHILHGSHNHLFLQKPVSQDVWINWYINDYDLSWLVTPPFDNQQLQEGVGGSSDDRLYYSSPYFFSGLLISLLLWPSSGEAVARLSVFQSPGSSRGRVQFTFWPVKCNRLAGALLRFGYKEEMVQPSMSEWRHARESGSHCVFGFYSVSSSSWSSWLPTAWAGKPRPTCTQPLPPAPLGIPTPTGIPVARPGSAVFSAGYAWNSSWGRTWNKILRHFEALQNILLNLRGKMEGINYKFK